MLLKGYLLMCLTIFFVKDAQSQRYLVLDRYGTKKIRIYPGEQLVFKLKDQRRKQGAVITQLSDSSVVLAGDVYLSLNDFDTFYFDRPRLRGLRNSSWVLVAGFLIGAAVEPLLEEAFYDPEESVMIALGIMAVAQSTRLYQWKKFRLNKRSRIWIGGVTELP